MASSSAEAPAGALADRASWARTLWTAGSLESWGASAELEAKVAADPNDHQARFDLAEAQSAAGDFKGAVDNLLHIVKADREWNEQAARKQLLTIFEAAGAELRRRQGRAAPAVVHTFFLRAVPCRRAMFGRWTCRR